MDPAGLKYAKTHEWADVDGDVATIGITDFAVQQLTDLVYIELPDVGVGFGAGKAFGEVESVKAVSDLYAPLGGEVIEVNESLLDDPAILTEDPFGKGWLIKLKIANSAALEGLLDCAAYLAHCAAEEH